MDRIQQVKAGKEKLTVAFPLLVLPFDVLFRVVCMFHDDESKRCVKDPKGSLETLLANLHATPGPGAHQIPSPFCEKSSALKQERGRPENPILSLFLECFPH